MNNKLALNNPNFKNTDFFVYGVTFASIAATANASSIVQVEANSDFYLTKITYFASLAGAVQTDSTRVIPLITLQIADTGSSRNLFNQAVPLSCVAGEGDLPFITPLQRLFRANASININLSNFSAATTYRLDLCLIGYKVFN